MQLNQAIDYMKNLYDKGKEAINNASLKAYVSTDNKLNGVITALLVPQAVQQDTTQNTTSVDSTNVTVDGNNGSGEEIISGLVMLLGFGLIAKGKTERDNYNFIKESYPDSNSAKLRHESKGTGKMVSGGVLLAGGSGSLIYFLTQG